MNQILAMQLELQQLIAKNSDNVMDCPSEAIFTSNINMATYITNQAFFLQQEIIELAEEFGGKDILKPWKINHIAVAEAMSVITDNTKSEAIDALCFCLNICLAAGITPDNIMDEYSKVWVKNINRQHDGY
jgi:hypothetical protein